MGSTSIKLANDWANGEYEGATINTSEVASYALDTLRLITPQLVVITVRQAVLNVQRWNTLALAGGPTIPATVNVDGVSKAGKPDSVELVWASCWIGTAWSHWLVGLE